MHKEPNHRGYTIRAAERHELEAITAFGKGLVGNSHIDVETLRRRFDINANIVTCLFSDNGAEHERLLGYFIAYPLTGEADKKIRDLSILNGRGISDDDLLPAFSEATALYLGMLGARGGRANGLIVEALMAQWATLLDKGKLMTVHARGATRDGNRFLDRFGFQPLPSPSEVSSVSLKNIGASSRLKRHLESARGKLCR